MRTDSVNLSEYATEGSKVAIAQMMGDQYVHPRHFRYEDQRSSGSARSHPPDLHGKPDPSKASAQERKLYDLVWKRTIASQMADAELEKTTATIGISKSGNDKFTATGEVIKFDGFLRVYRESYDDDNEQEDESRLLPPLKKGQNAGTSGTYRCHRTFHSTPATLYGSQPGAQAGGAGNRTSVHLRSDHFYYPATRICGEGG